MTVVKCPNCGKKVERGSEFLGKQVGCIHCRCVYFLSEHYHDDFFKRIMVINSVTLCLIVIGVFIKIENDYRLFSDSAKAATDAVNRKIDQTFADKTVSAELSFYDFDRAYGTFYDKLKRTRPVVLPQHKGRIVQWSGEVLEVFAVKDSPYGDFYVKFRQTPGSAADVTLYFLSEDADKLADLKKGHFAKYQGVIVSAAFGQTDHILRRGKILD